MTARTLTLLSTAAIALVACQPKTDTTNVTNTMTTTSMSDANDSATTNDMMPAATGAQTFVNTAAASDAFEIATSKLALATSGSASIKAFAEKMIAAHTGSTAKLKGIVATMTPPLTPDPALSTDQQATLDSLKAKTGTDFDTAYASAQVNAHTATLAALKDYAATGDAPALKTFATGLEPTVADHLKMAQALK